MARRAPMTDTQVEEEIKKLTQDPDVKLQNKLERLRYKRRLYLRQLQNDKMHGEQLRMMGVTKENIEQKFYSGEIQ